MRAKAYRDLLSRSLQTAPPGARLFSFAGPDTALTTHSSPGFEAAGADATNGGAPASGESPLRGSGACSAGALGFASGLTCPLDLAWDRDAYTRPRKYACAVPCGYRAFHRPFAPLSARRGAHSHGRYARHIPSVPERILDAPELLDDFYLNLLDWSSANVLSVALGPTVYLWNAADGAIDQLMELQAPNERVTSIAWNSSGDHLAIGLSDHTVQLWDVTKHQQVARLGRALAPDGVWVASEWLLVAV